jgi:hypothetical protein
VGRILDELARRLRRAVDERGVVLWFDPDHAYAGVLEALRTHSALADITVLAHDGSHLALRSAAEPHLNVGFEGDGGSPRLVCYVPLSKASTGGALVEIEALGAIAEPGAHHDLNTRLAVVARAALRTMLTPAQLDDVGRQAEKGTFTLADLEKLAASSGAGALDLIFETSNPIDLVLRFLADPTVDAALIEKEALPSLVATLAEAFGYRASDAPTPPSLREDLSLFLLGGEYLLRLGDQAPPAFVSFPRAATDGQAKRLTETVERWRSDARLRESYVAAADRAQERLRVGDHPITDLDTLAGVETFRITERWRQDAVTHALLAGPNARAAGIAHRHRQAFWVEAASVVERTVRWRLLETIARLLDVAGRIDEGLAANPTAGEIARAYAMEDAPWCELDQAQRRVEADFSLFAPERRRDPATGEIRDDLEVLVERARARYRDVVGALAERFVRSLADCNFRLAALPRQRSLFSTVVGPMATTKKTAYILVDALRFEMARELAGHPSAGWSVDLAPAMATIPTLTPVGMAALMPRAERGFSLALKGTTLVPTIADGVELKDRSARVKHLQNVLGAGVSVHKLDDLTPLTEKVRGGIAKASFVLVTSTEIDEAGENVSPGQAWKVMNAVLEDLRRALTALRDVGGERKNGERPIDRVVIVADHGYVFAGELTEGEKIDAPGSGAHRRVWIGRGGEANPAYVRFQAKDVDLGGELEFAVPWNLSAFRTSGGTAYLHGGLSPQELIIPVLTLVRVGAAGPGGESKLAWTLRIPGNRITSRLVLVSVEGIATEMLPVSESVRLKVEVRQGQGVLSEMKTASASFDDVARVAVVTRDPDDHRRLTPTQIALLIVEEDVPPGPVSVHLLDADTGVELVQLPDVPFSVM